MSSDATENRSFEDKVQDRQDWIESQFRRISRGSWARIIRMARKPTAQEFKQTSIICGIGLFVLGAIGFVMLVMMDNFFPWLFDVKRNFFCCAAANPMATSQLCGMAFGVSATHLRKSLPEFQNPLESQSNLSTIKTQVLSVELTWAVLLLTSYPSWLFQAPMK
jgi:protein transport protein SEC61 subunit gamma-like protein